MKWPWVSRRYAELLETELSRVRTERDAYRDQADRAKDELISHIGFQPVSAPVREELRQTIAELEKFEQSLTLEDPHSGMISDEVLQLTQDLAGEDKKPS